MANPNLGYGKPTEASIDQVNQWMRSTPWYQSKMQQWGQDPGHPTLNKDQSNELRQMAQAQGVVVDEGDMEIDNHGNFNPKGHKLRNGIIIAGIAAATIATMGAAGAFAGAAGAGAGGASGAAGGAAAAGAGSAAGAGGALASSTIGTGMMGGIAGGTGLGAGAGSSMGIGSMLAGAAKKYGSQLLTDKGSEMVGRGLANSSQALAANRGTMAELMLDQNSDLEKQLLAREQEQRMARSTSYRDALTGNRAATWEPLVRPPNITGSYKGMTPEGKGAGNELYAQAMNRMTAPDLRNNNSGMPAYKNLGQDPKFNDQLHSGLTEKLTGVGSYALPFINSMLGKK